MSRTSVHPKWPGQVAALNFDLAQVTALASVRRSEVFFTFNALEPMSTAEVAAALGKKPTAVRYHVNELVRVGLIIPVETRKRRSRIEDAYVHKAVECYSRHFPLDDEYVRQVNRGFNAILRHMSKERAAAMNAKNVAPDAPISTMYIRQNLRLSPESAREISSKLIDVLEEAKANAQDDGPRYHLGVYMTSELSVSREVFEKATGRAMKETIDEPED